MTRRWIAVLPFAAAVLIAAGCGGGSGGGSSSSGSGSSAASGTQAASQSDSGYGGRYATPPARSAAPAAGAALVKTRRLDLGTVLVGPNGRTLYLFEKDHGGTSACTGACAQAWRPLTTTGSPKAAAGTKASMLSTIKRADGTTQVTYGGHPLYSFFGDTRPGQDAGQGMKAFGASWYVVTPAGSKIDES